MLQHCNFQSKAGDAQRLQEHTDPLRMRGQRENPAEGRRSSRRVVSCLIPASTENELECVVTVGDWGLGYARARSSMADLCPSQLLNSE